MNIFGKIATKIRNNKKKTAIYILLLLLILSLYSYFSKDDEIEEKQDDVRRVEIARVFDAVSGDLNLPVVGTVESQKEAVIRAESSGQIVRVYKKLGDPVSVGTIIAEIENSSERADLLRAQGVYDVAFANYSKLNNNSDENLSLIKSSIRQSYIISDDVVRTKVDQFFTSSSIYNANMINALQDYKQREIVEKQRVEIERLLVEWNKNISKIDSSISGTELKVYINQSENNLIAISNFLNQVAISLNDFESGPNISQSSIDKYRSDISQGRNSITSSLNNLLSVSSSLKSQVGFQSKGEDIIVAEANVTQAKAGILSAQSRLNKTIIKSPIRGLVNSVDIKTGDVVNTYEEVAYVVGDGSVEIITFINNEDKARISEGGEVTIDGKWKGTITTIAPATNSNTNKVEVRITPEKGVELTNGETVSLQIKRSLEETKGKQIVSLPISAVKITGESANVFMVDVKEKKVYTKNVTIGEILGDRVVIEEGLSMEDIIVIDSRGLKDGDLITF